MKLHWLIVIALCWGLLLSQWNMAQAQVGGIFADKTADAVTIRKALERGTEYLLSIQAADGSWSGHAEQPGAVTALCTLALVNSGVPINDPRIEKAIKYLLTVKTNGKVYASSVIIMALSIVNPQDHALVIQEHVRTLVQAQRRDGNNIGGWHYDANGNSSDNSNAQFALLGLHEAARALPALKIPDDVWKNALQYWSSSQNADGSWGYQYVRNGADFTGTGSMTCAGLSSLLIAQSHLPELDAQLFGEKLNCCKTDNGNDAVEKGLDWLGKHFTVNRNPSNRGAGGSWTLYYLYGMERVGRLTGRRFFNGVQQHDWYRTGADYFVKNQQINGTWAGSNPLEDASVATCFGLLFLSKGRRPVVIGKARWGIDQKDQQWNRHRQDVANLTTYVEQAWKKDFPIGLSWQVVDLEKATVEDLLQVPVLFISGSQGIVWGQDRVQLLRDYIDRGGFIFAEACCEKGPQFDTSFRQFVANMFADKPEHQLKLLEPTHAIWRAERPVPPEAVRGMWGLDYGCRTCMVYVPPRTPSDPPGNLGCWWQLDHTRERTFLNRANKLQLTGSYDLGLNVLAYATNRELKGKDENLNLKVTDKKPPTDKRDLVYIAKLKHPGGCDTAPGALPGILRAAEQQLDFRVAVEPRLIDISGTALFDYHLVMMHGRNSFRLTPGEREQLRKFVERGGTILADSICSSPSFTESFRAELKEIFPTVTVETIPTNHVLMTNKYGGFDLSRVTLRQPRGGNADPLQANKKIGPPVLDGIKQGDRYAVVFSPYDLSCALERHDSLECEGYTRDDAERISLNVLLYSLLQ